MRVFTNSWICPRSVLFITNSCRKHFLVKFRSRVCPCVFCVWYFHIPFIKKNIVEKYEGSKITGLKYFDDRYTWVLYWLGSDIAEMSKAYSECKPNAWRPLCMEAVLCFGLGQTWVGASELAPCCRCKHAASRVGCVVYSCRSSPAIRATCAPPPSALRRASADRTILPR